MAWDASRRRPEALPPFPDRHLLCVDEVKINNSQTLHTQDARAKMGLLLSPVAEEDRILALDAPLQVTVLVRFHDPAVRSVYSRTYCTSQSFLPTDRICRGLLRRINHCSEEFITRKDPDALNSTQCLRKGPKSLRFELVFEIQRKGDSSPWASRIFRSYQKRALTDASARDVIRSTHNTIGIFLRRHDDAFRWTDDPTHEHVSARPETFKPSSTGPLDLTCVPRARFVEPTQVWEFVPGYSLKLTLKSNNPARYQHGMRRLSKIDSSQATPLNLGLSEDLLSQAFRSVQDAFDQKQNAFELAHASCNVLEGTPDCDCQHWDEGALTIELRVVNNLGPIYGHLARSLKSRLRLFSHPTGQDCDDFVSKISARLTQFRDRYDDELEKLNDFEFRITELTGHGWQVKNCARFAIDGRNNHSRQIVEALLDRIRTGVCDVLRGHDVAIHMVAYKRGHLILDKALIARDHQFMSHQETSGPIVDEKRTLVAELQRRVRRDIDAICKDTCSLDDIHGPAPATPDRSPRFTYSFATPRRPSTPRSPLSRLHEWTQPGSPGSFATRPSTPPQVPLRKPSLRVFPLVPAKYKEETEQSPGGPVTLRDSAIGMDSVGESRALDGTARSESVDSLGLPAVILEDHHELASGTNKSALQPAAELYPAPRAPDYETDSNSTHSSMPALSESDDAPSPQASMLITPNVVRSASPGSRGVPCYDDTDLTHFPGPLMLSSSVPNSTTFSEVERFAEPKVARPQPSALQAGSTTPMRASSAEKSAPVDTPKASVDCSGDEKTPLAHRQMQGPTDSDPTRHCGDNAPAIHDTFPTTNDSNRDSVLPSQGSSDPEPDCSAAEIEAPGGAEDDLEFAQGDLPSEGLLQCHVEEGLVPASGPHENPDITHASGAVTVCESSETLRPSGPDNAFPSQGSDESDADYSTVEIDASESAQDDLPTEGFLLCHVEEKFVPVSELHENPDSNNGSVAVEEEFVAGSELPKHTAQPSIAIQEEPVPVSESHEHADITDDPVAVEEELLPASETHEHSNVTPTSAGVVEEDLEPVSELHGFPDTTDACGFVEEELVLANELHEKNDSTHTSAVAGICASSETLSLSTPLGDGCYDNDAGLLNEDPGRAEDEAEPHYEEAMKDEAELSHTVTLPVGMVCDVPEQVEEEILPELSEMPEEAEFSGSTEEPGRGLWPDSIETFGDEPAPDDESCYEPERSEQDNDSAIGPEALDCKVGDQSQPESDPGSVGLSERQEFLAHALPFSDSGIDIGTVSEVADVSGPEIDETPPSSLIDEISFPRDGLSHRDSELTRSEQEKISEPMDNDCERLGDETTPASPSTLSMTAAQVPDVAHDDPEPAEQALVPAPKPALAALSPPKPRISVPNHKTSRSISNSHPSPSQIGLGNSYLLPPLPLFANFTTNDITTSRTRDSWSSSSSWEDCVSTGRQSSDSVDTIKQSPLPVSDEEAADCPKRLGTPTAGLLGLNESRWADFGLRTALTGTHAYDGSSSTQFFEDNESSRDEAKLKQEQENDINEGPGKHMGTSSSRKGFHLRHKSSVASIILAGRLNRKESRELRQLKKKESKDLKKQAKAAKSTTAAKEAVSVSAATRDDDDSAGRLPQAMMLVAGLAFASSLVSRNH